MLDRMGVEVPESAKILLFQEDKLKNTTTTCTGPRRIRPREHGHPRHGHGLEPHFNDMEAELRPGMVTLTWTSMNIDSIRRTCTTV